MKKLTKLIITMCVCVPAWLFAWGPGHNTHIEWVLNYLPAEVRNFWSPEQQQLMIKRWSHYPDGPAEKKYEFSKEEEEIMGDDLPYIARATDKKRDRLHRPYSKGIEFFALAKAFRENRPDKAALYAGTLLHAYADGGAFNHGSMMQYLRYTKYKHVKYPKLRHDDLWKIRNDKAITARAREIIGDFKPDSRVKKLDEALCDIMMTGVIADKNMAAQEVYIGKVNKDGSPSKESAEAIAKTLATQTMDGVNIVYSAWLIAKSDQPLDPEKLDLAWLDKPLSERPVFAEYRRRFNAYIRARDARDDSVYNGLWNNKKYPAVGFIAESSYEMGMGEHGFGSRFATSSIARAFKKSGGNVELFSFPDIEKSAPDAEKIPILVIHSKNGVAKRLRANVDKYIKNGGKIIFIGGLNEGPTTMKIAKRPNNETPVSREWGRQNDDVVFKVKIELCPRLQKISPEKVLGFNDNPNQTGWNKPVAVCEILPDKDVMPLMNLVLPDGSKYCVASAKKVDGKFKYVYVPAYMFLPFMFSKETEMPDWSQPITDSFGSALFAECVRILSENK